MAVAAYNVRTLAVKGKNGYGHGERVLVKGRRLGCNFIGLQETRRSSSARRSVRQGIAFSVQVRKKPLPGKDCTEQV